MEIDNNQLYNFLKFNGLKYLYYTTNVLTTNELIKVGGFISIKKANDLKLSYSEYHKKSFYQKFDIYEDIFFNSFDYHNFYLRPNYFGNVSFQVSIEILIDEATPPIAITKNNPLYWNKSIKNMYYKDMDEYIKDFYKGINNIELYQQMCYVFKNCKDIIPFEPYLKSIIVDNPKFKVKKRDIFKISFKELRKTIKESNSKINLVERTCSNRCICKISYQDMEEDKLLQLYNVNNT